MTNTLISAIAPPSYWHCQGKSTCESILHIYLKPKLIAQGAEASNFVCDRIEIVNSTKKLNSLKFGKRYTLGNG